MANLKQIKNAEPWCGRPSLNVFDPDSTPSWKLRGTKGWMSAHFKREASGALSIDITEAHEKSARRVIVEIDEQAVAMLIAMLDRPYK